MSKAISIAKEFVRRSCSDDIEVGPLTSHCLQELLYCAQGWSIVLRERQLFPDEFEAGQNGPMLPDVFDVGAHESGAVLVALDQFDEAPDVLDDEAEFVTAVWNAYKSNSQIGHDAVAIAAIEELFGQLSIPEPLRAYREKRLDRERKAASAISARPPLDAERLRAAAQIRKVQTV